MTEAIFQPTHTVPAHGRRVPVVIVDANDTLAGRPAIRVEAEFRAFTLQGMDGFWSSNRASYYPDFLRPIEAEVAA